jgi:hypothetical protein
MAKFSVNFQYLYQDNIKSVSNIDLITIFSTLKHLSQHNFQDITIQCIKGCFAEPKESAQMISWINHHNESESTETSNKTKKIIRFKFSDKGRFFGFRVGDIFYITIIDPQHKMYKC